MVSHGKALATTRRVVIFRTDASLEIGTGHVMRCLTLASVLRERGVLCQFVCREHPGHLVDQIRHRGFDAYVLPFVCKLASGGTLPGSSQSAHLPGTDWVTDAQQTRDLLNDTLVDYLIVDHYALDVNWERSLRSSCRQLMVIDDLANRFHDCDILLDQNLHTDAVLRYRPLVPASCRLLLGPSHVLLSPAFDAPAPRLRNGEIRTVLVYFGGNDINNQAGRTVEALTHFPDIHADVILGTAHPYREMVFAAARGYGQLRVIDNCTDMAGAMRWADLGVGTCGMAAWERCAVGLTTLVSVSADNQREDAEALDRLGAVEHLGEARDIDAARWIDAISRALADSRRIMRMGEIARSIVVGHQENRRILIDLLTGFHVC